MGSEVVTWEPVGHFFQRYAVDFIAYCREKRLNVDVVDYLARHPAQTAALRGDDIAIRVVNALMVPKPPEVDLGLHWEEPPEDYLVEWRVPTPNFEEPFKRKPACTPDPSVPLRNETAESVGSVASLDPPRAHGLVEFRSSTPSRVPAGGW